MLKRLLSSLRGQVWHELRWKRDAGAGELEIVKPYCPRCWSQLLGRGSGKHGKHTCAVCGTALRKGRRTKVDTCDPRDRPLASAYLCLSQRCVSEYQAEWTSKHETDSGFRLAITIGCRCMTSPLDYGEYGELFDTTKLGIDDAEGRYAEVSIDRCKHCGQLWLNYEWEAAAFSKSDRWYRGVITAEQAERAAAGGALTILGGLSWHLYGGRYYGTRGRRCERPLRRDFA